MKSVGFSPAVFLNDCKVCGTYDGVKIKKIDSFHLVPAKDSKLKAIFIVDTDADLPALFAAMDEWSLKDTSLVLTAIKCHFKVDDDESKAHISETCAIWTRMILRYLTMQNKNVEVVVCGDEALQHVGGRGRLAQFETKSKFEYGRVTYLPISQLDTKQARYILRRLYDT